MIKVVETHLYYSGKYKKTLIITLFNYGFSDWKRVLVLMSKQSYNPPVSKKRWNLIDKFLKEGCDIELATLDINADKICRKEVLLSVEEIIKIGSIKDEYIIKLLNELDQKEKS